MKYIVIVGDGMADRPLKSLRGRSCLEVANTPNMDYLASHGEVGMVRTIPQGFEPGSDIANLSIMGYDPRKYYTGRAPIEAEFRRIDLSPEDVAFRCNLVTLSKDAYSDPKNAVMEDYSAGHISTQEAVKLIDAINESLGNEDIVFYSGVSYRHLMVWKNGRHRMRCTPPHDITGKKIIEYLPKGSGSKTIMDLMKRSYDILMNHPVNSKRLQRGQRPANSIWLWGQGKKPCMPLFRDKYGIDGALISAVDLTRGLGVCAGWEILSVKGATGYIDTNYEGKARAALRALKKYDLVYVHVEAPDEAGHSGDYRLKIKAIEDFDSRLVGTILDGLQRIKDYKILLLPDHATPVSIRTHSAEPVPFVIYTNNNEKNRKRKFSERISRMKDARFFDKGYKLMDYFINRGQG